jgi:hypothetical protein
MIAMICGGISQKMIFARNMPILTILNIWRILNICADVYGILAALNFMRYTITQTACINGAIILCISFALLPDLFKA